MSPSYAGIIAEAIKRGKTEEEIAKAAEELGKNTEEATTQAPANQNGGTATNAAKTVASTSTGATGAAPITSTNQDVSDIYEVLAPMAGDYLNAQAEQIGMAQRSMGPLAAAAMGQSQTAGLGNYTYNRLMRPRVDVMRDEIRVQGYANQLNKLLSDALNKARNNYNKSGGGGTTKDTNSTTYDGNPEEEEKEKSNPKGSDYNPNDSVKGGYKFDHMGYVPGYTGQYPLHVQTPTGETTYQDYTSNIRDPFEKGKAWVKYLKSIGYAG